MKETTFIQKNSQRWKEMEMALNSDINVDPDYAYDLFIQLTDDLAFARTYFPKAQTTEYLNNLASRSYNVIYKNKKIKRNKFPEFWKFKYPLLIRKYRRFIVYSFGIFFISFLIGLLSSLYDPGFVRLILSDKYVNMTMENIRGGDPLAVYKSMNQADSFFMISTNNIYISFLAFIGGILLTFGTVWLLFQNGIMLGTFLYLFFQKDLMPEALSVIFIHGTLEIFSIIVAGAAGLVMGSSIILAHTRSRLDSFKRGTIDGIYMVVGLVPVFLIAALFEGFVTRYTSMPEFLKLLIIFLSLCFIIFYFYIYPNRLNSKNYGTVEN